MNLSQYLKGRLPQIIALMLSLLFVCLLLAAFGHNISAMFFACITLLLLFTSASLFDFWRRRRFYSNLYELVRSLENDQNATLITEIMQKPDFIEAKIAYDALRIATKSMNDNITKYRHVTEEYREYLETWVHEIKTPIAAALLLLENARHNTLCDTAYQNADDAIATSIHLNKNNTSIATIKEHSAKKYNREFEKNVNVSAQDNNANDMTENELACETMALINNISHELARIEDFVEQALYYTRSAAVENDYVIRRHKLADIVRLTLRKHSRLLIASQVSVNISEIPNDYVVLGDHKWLSFILGQIINNAIKYRKQGKAVCCLTFSARVFDSIELYDYSSICLYVHDNGIGIPPEDLKRVFQKGFTGTNGRSNQYSTGMGLYLCKRLCEKMGLKIFVKSDTETETGTTVCIVFPRDELRFLLS
ncbi:MAG: hypothetical protein LBG97_00570 [Coriobacteriales bacterium]|jgi:signal transduction histidine kinase|nr:hypothetical protein [Coriobacteriales bacterium]